MRRIINFLKKYEFPVHVFILLAIARRSISVGFHTLSARLKLCAFGCFVGTGFRVHGKVWIWTHRKGAIRIGDNVLIVSRFGSNLIGLTNPAVLQCLGDGSISIGANSGLSAPVICARSTITIGRHAKIGGNVRILDHDFHSLDAVARRGVGTEGHIESRPIQIGDDVFIGTNAIILKGSIIGDRAVIGAGSVVTGIIPADEIWAGNPARRVRVCHHPESGESDQHASRVPEV